jgi:hypothetical protein
VSFLVYYQRLIDAVTANAIVKDVYLGYDSILPTRGSVEGHLILATGHLLYTAEYVIVESTFIRRPKYRFHLQTAAGKLVRRWDNAPHHRHIATFPHHCHLADGRVVPSPPMDLQAVLDAAIPLLDA